MALYSTTIENDLQIHPRCRLCCPLVSVGPARKQPRDDVQAAGHGSVVQRPKSCGVFLADAAEAILAEEGCHCIVTFSSFAHVVAAANDVAILLGLQTSQIRSLQVQLPPVSRQIPSLKGKGQLPVQNFVHDRRQLQPIILDTELALANWPSTKRQDSANLGC